MQKHGAERICSEECRIKRRQAYVYERYTPEYNAKRRKKRNSLCVLCGKPMNHKCVPMDTATRMHDTCVYIDCINALNTSGKLTDAQRQRITVRGYTLKSFKEEFNEYILDSPISNENEREQGCNAYDGKLLFYGDMLADEAYRAINEGVKNND